MIQVSYNRSLTLKTSYHALHAHAYPRGTFEYGTADNDGEPYILTADHTPSFTQRDLDELKSAFKKIDNTPISFTDTNE